MPIVLDKNLGSAYQSGDYSTIAFTTTQAVAAGATIIIGVGWFSETGNLSSVADDSGNGYTYTIDKQGRPADPSFDNSAIVRVLATSGLASGTVITATFSVVVGAPTIGGNSFTGVETSSPLDGTPVGPTGTADSTAWASASMTLLAGSLMYAHAWAENTGAGSTPTSPAVEGFDAANPTNGFGGTGAYRIETSAGSYAVAGTWGSTSKACVCAVAYKASSAVPQTIRPDADTTTTGWTTTPLYSKINDESDATVITATAS